MRHVLEAIDDAMKVLTAHNLGFDHEAEPTYWRRRTRKVNYLARKLPEEDSITDVLTRALEYVRDNSLPDSYLKRNQVCFPQQQPRRQQRRLGPYGRTTDIQARSLNQSFLDLRIEAKILFDGSDVDHYCGENGLLRFSDVEPYTDQPIGMMIGYTLRDDAAWLSRIEANAIASSQVRGFGNVTVGGTTVRISSSISVATNEVSVIHLVLPFRTDPDCR